MKRICVFCGSYTGKQDFYMAAARQMGAGIAAEGWELVYGGGHVGLMGAVADGALEAGGRVVGVIPRSLSDKELAHRGLTELHVVSSMHERKALMADLSDAFIAMPGGFGTLDELFEIITWAQLGFHRKPIALLNLQGYFDPMLMFINHIAEAGFISNSHSRNALLVRQEAPALLETLRTYEAPSLVKWSKD